VGGYVEIGGIRTWYEAAGQGEPLVMLHGGLSTNAQWGGLIDTLAEHYRVVAAERRGHGRTPDVAGPITYEAMADDTIGLIENVVEGPTHVLGWSDGAIVGMMVALRRPDLVRKLVFYSGNVEVAAVDPKFLAVSPGPADMAAFEPFRVAYQATSPDGPDHWPAVFDKVTSLWRAEVPISLLELGTLGARTLLLFADDDLIALDHAVALYRAIPDVELAVMPGTSHMAHLEKPALFSELVLDFLRLDPVLTLAPLRRGGATV